MSPREKDVVKILVTSDIHLGILGNDDERRDESFVTFEEVLQNAVEYDVDLILVCGNLFHNRNTSLQTFLRCESLIEQYCYGDKKPAIRVDNIPFYNHKLLYPIFSMQGSRDGTGLFSLARKQRICYMFNKFYDEVIPAFIKKGGTILALYGMSYTDDVQCIIEGNTRFVERDKYKKQINLFALHQKRRTVTKDEKDKLPMKYVPNFMNLVVWGHESECEIEEKWINRKKFYVMQPGSTIATSYCAGEAVLKHCGLLEVSTGTFRIFPIRLQTVRPFVFKNICLPRRRLCEKESEALLNFLKKKVEEAILKAVDQKTGHEQQPELPLIRLNVTYMDNNQQFNVLRFGRQFRGRVANPDDIVRLKKGNFLKNRSDDNTDFDALD